MLTLSLVRCSCSSSDGSFPALLTDALLLEVSLARRPSRPLSSSLSPSSLTAARPVGPVRTASRRLTAFLTRRVDNPFPLEMTYDRVDGAGPEGEALAAFRAIRREEDEARSTPSPPVVDLARQIPRERQGCGYGLRLTTRSPFGTPRADRSEARRRPCSSTPRRTRPSFLPPLRSPPPPPPLQQSSSPPPRPYRSKPAQSSRSSSTGRRASRSPARTCLPGSRAWSGRCRRPRAGGSKLSVRLARFGVLSLAHFLTLSLSLLLPTRRARAYEQRHLRRPPAPDGRAPAKARQGTDGPRPTVGGRRLPLARRRGRVGARMAWAEGAGRARVGEVGVGGGRWGDGGQGVSTRLTGRQR